MGLKKNVLHCANTTHLPAPPPPFLDACTNTRYCGSKTVHLPAVEVSCGCHVRGYQILELEQWWWLYSPAP